MRKPWRMIGLASLFAILAAQADFLASLATITGYDLARVRSEWSNWTAASRSPAIGHVDAETSATAIDRCLQTHTTEACDDAVNEIAARCALRSDCRPCGDALLAIAKRAEARASSCRGGRETDHWCTEDRARLAEAISRAKTDCQGLLD